MSFFEEEGRGLQSRDSFFGRERVAFNCCGECREVRSRVHSLPIRELRDDDFFCGNRCFEERRECGHRDCDSCGERRRDDNCFRDDFRRERFDFDDRGRCGCDRNDNCGCRGDCGRRERADCGRGERHEHRERRHGRCGGGFLWGLGLGLLL